MRRLLAILISIVPHHFVSRGLFFLSRYEAPWLQQWLIQIYNKLFAIDLSDAAESELANYPTLNQFFVRALKPAARPIDSDKNSFVSPVDGRISQCGQISAQNILQAKGREYSVAALLGDSHDPKFDDGAFSTIYLSPKDYHRIHMPISGDLVEMTYIPGRLFSVAPFCVDNIDAVFARNERVVAIFETAIGKLALVLVGAINVSAIETVWDGLITPRKNRATFSKTYAQPVALAKGEEMGRFNMGSTVIVITESDKIDWLEHTRAAGATLRLGEKIAEFKNSVI